jgi:hypothetical protein
MTKQQRFDRILEILGLAKGSGPAAKRSKSRCRPGRHGAAMTDQLFEEAPIALSLKRQLPCAEREVRCRHHAHPNRIATKRTSAAKAVEEIGPHGPYSSHFRHLLDAAA